MEHEYNLGDHCKKSRQEMVKSVLGRADQDK